MIDWCERYLLVPSGPLAGEPWRFTQEQMRIVAWWYAIKPDGRFQFRRGVIRRPKGWGKDPLAAVLAIAEMIGPVRFSHFEDGEAIGKPDPSAEVYVAANSERQTRNTTNLIPGLLNTECLAEYRWELGRQIWRAHVGEREVRLEQIASAFESVEGARPTFYVSGETQHWRRGNGGHALAAVTKRNLAKMPGGTARELCITNAHSPDVDSIAERDYDAWVEQQEPEYEYERDIYYDSIEPDVGSSFDYDDDDQVLEAMEIAYGDAHWVDFKRLLAEMRDPNMPDSEGKRFYLNLVVAGEGAWMDPSTWDAAYSEDPLPRRRRHITLGFDGSRIRDATALVATDMETGFQWLAGVWERNWLQEEWEVPEDHVRSIVASLFREYRVVRCYADPFYWEDVVADWANEWPKVVASQTTAGTPVNLARAVAAYHHAISDGACTHGGPDSDVFRRHVLNAVNRAVGGRAGEDLELATISKKSKSSRDSIDAAMAGVLSWWARQDALTAGWKPRKFRATVISP
ncbi:MAG: hypothetical protein F4Z28_05135 [Gammaproteobacteria bacterium]|nr:hypothetical protein [Gammaproteobacteria bacterium]